MALTVFTAKVRSSILRKDRHFVTLVHTHALVQLAAFQGVLPSPPRSGKSRPSESRDGRDSLTREYACVSG